MYVVHMYECMLCIHHLACQAGVMHVDPRRLKLGQLRGGGLTFRRDGGLTFRLARLVLGHRSVRGGARYQGLQCFLQLGLRRQGLPKRGDGFLEELAGQAIHASS